MAASFCKQARNPKLNPASQQPLTFGDFVYTYAHTYAINLLLLLRSLAQPAAADLW
jgi:hypothetical protein